MPPSSSAAATRARRGKVRLRIGGEPVSLKDVDDGRRRRRQTTDDELGSMPFFSRSLSSFLSSLSIVPRSRRLSLQHDRDETPFCVPLAKDWMRFQAGERLYKAKKVFALSFSSSRLASSLVLIVTLGASRASPFFLPRLRPALSRAHRNCSPKGRRSRARSRHFHARERGRKKVACKAECEGAKRAKASRRAKAFVLLLNLLPLFPL